MYMMFSGNKFPLEIFLRGQQRKKYACTDNLRECNFSFLRTHLLMKPLSRCTQRNTLFAPDKIAASEMYLRETRASLEFALRSRDSIIACAFVLSNTNTITNLAHFIHRSNSFYTYRLHALLPWRKTQVILCSITIREMYLAILSFPNIIIDISFFK